jgi:glutamate carboxypeptidase
MEPWVAGAAEEIAGRAERELEALVGVSSPSGDVRGAEEVLAIVHALLPEGAEETRLPCSSEGHAPDLLATVRGTGVRRLLLLGHVDTVVAHADHRPLEVAGALAARPEGHAEVVLLLVCDEEWRTADFAHAARFAGFDACLCFEAGQTAPDGTEEVVVRRKAAGTLIVSAHGRSAHSGSAPDRGANALLALAEAARAVAACHDPAGPARLTAVPTVLNCGEAFNVVPGEGELVCDLRADDTGAFAAVRAAVPPQVGGVRLEQRMLRVWPGMDASAAAARVLAAAGAELGRPVLAGARGGASDASNMAASVPLTIDGLGPRGGNAHHPDEFVSRASLLHRAQVALAVARACLAA